MINTFTNTAPLRPMPNTYSHPHMPQVVYSTHKLQHINMIIPSTTQQGGVYIGDTVSLLKPQILEEKNIKAVLCCNHEAASNLNRIPTKISFKFMEMQDHYEYPIQVHFDTSYQYIQKYRSEGKNVLVQCHAGVSRSATMVCAYLIQKHKIRAEEALRLVREKRPRAKPNQGFWARLQEYSNQIIGEEKIVLKKYPETQKKEVYRKENEEDDVKIQNKRVNIVSPQKFYSTQKLPVKQSIVQENHQAVQLNRKYDQFLDMNPQFNIASSRCEASITNSRNRQNGHTKVVQNEYCNNYENRRGRQWFMRGNTRGRGLVTPEKQERSGFSVGREGRREYWNRNMSMGKYN